MSPILVAHAWLSAEETGDDTDAQRQEAEVAPASPVSVPRATASELGALGVVVVTVHSAEGLRTADNGARPDAYAGVRLTGRADCAWRTSTKWRTVNPVWNESHEFPAYLSDLTDMPLRLRIYNRDLTSFSDQLGEVEVALDELKAAVATNQARIRAGGEWSGHEFNGIVQGELLFENMPLAEAKIARSFERSSSGRARKRGSRSEPYKGSSKLGTSASTSSACCGQDDSHDHAAGEDCGCRIADGGYQVRAASIVPTPQCQRQASGNSEASSTSSGLPSPRVRALSFTSVSAAAGTRTPIKATTCAAGMARAVLGIPRKETPEVTGTVTFSVAFKLKYSMGMFPGAPVHASAPQALRRPPPPDAIWLERARDRTLLFLGHKVFLYIAVLWAASVVSTGASIGFFYIFLWRIGCGTCNLGSMTEEDIKYSANVGIQVRPPTSNCHLLASRSQTTFEIGLTVELWTLLGHHCALLLLQPSDCALAARHWDSPRWLGSTRAVH